MVHKRTYNVAVQHSVATVAIMAAQAFKEELSLKEALGGLESGLSAAAQIARILRVVRAHLDMDVGFVSEFTDGRRYFRQVDSASADAPIAVGGSDPLDDSYCQRIVDGRLPELMQDACEIPAALEMPVTKALPVGAHLSVPLRLADGRLYGTFCCFSFTPDHSLNERDLKILRAFAAITAELIQAELDLRQAHEEARAEIEAVLRTRRVAILYQPIYSLRSDRLTGFEALARFGGERTPDLWFNTAAAIGLGDELEHLAVARACEGLSALPPHTALGVNLSPGAVMSPALDALFADLPLDRIVLEITEHAVVEDYAALAARLAPWRAAGLRLAVDDAGAGHSSLRHVLDLRPDIIKLDKSLTENLAHDDARRALATALTTFGQAIGSEIVAEGVETIAELTALQAIGVTKVQGFLLSRPLDLAAARATALTGVIARAMAAPAR